MSPIETSDDGRCADHPAGHSPHAQDDARPPAPPSPTPAANLTICPECGRPTLGSGHICKPRGYTDSADDACPLCGYWRCRCFDKGRVTLHTAGYGTAA